VTSDSATNAGPGSQPDEQCPLRAYEERIGLRFQNVDLLHEALTHRSYVNEHPGHPVSDNQRLEFLGDAVLDLIVGEWLFRRYPDADEGELTTVRAHIVRTETLASFAGEIALGQHLLLGKGELGSGGDDRSANLCAGFEALVGAAYLDAGLEGVRPWVHAFLEAHASEIDARAGSRDAKTRLQEAVQAALRVTPYYRIVSAVGPDHAKRFTAQALVDETVWGQGEGNTKQAAEQAAAKDALGSHRALRGAANP
jgi:ribonuclease-3